jgi:hypothetical protein
VAARYDPFVRAGWIALIAVLALVGCGSPRGDAASRQVLITDIRSTETIVVGHVFTELMTDDEIVAAALALCDMEGRLGLDPALEEAIAAVRALDWDAPANSSMVSRLLQVGAASVCRDTIREHEARYPGAFTEAISDDELVEMARGICQTIGELGPNADDELRLYQEAYGWTSDADSAAFTLVVDSSGPVCITVGS